MKHYEGTVYFDVFLKKNHKDPPELFCKKRVINKNTFVNKHLRWLRLKNFSPLINYYSRGSSPLCPQTFSIFVVRNILSPNLFQAAFQSFKKYFEAL